MPTAEIPSSQPAARMPRAGLYLLIILLVAAGLRMPALTISPPGLNQDEAANAWTSYCLLKTGKTPTGDTWPIFYYRAIGESSTLFVYLLMPFQAVFGLSAWSARLPGAVCGVASIALVYFVGRRLRDPATGLLAAALMAIDPWSVQLSRTGHEASITPFLILLPWAAAILAGLPFSADRPRLRPLIALLAGLATGVACYGYPAVRLCLPPFIFLCMLANGRDWLTLLNSRRGTQTLVAFLLAAIASFGPLVFEQFTNRDGIGRRYEMLYAWGANDSTVSAIAKLVHRYALHFGPDFLFVHGDYYELQHAQYFGQLLPALAPLFYIGLVVLLARVRSSASSRVLIAGLATYPIADTLFAHDTGHALRAATGLPVLLLTCAIGGVESARWLRRRSGLLARTAVCLWTATCLVLTAGFIRYFVRVFPGRPAAVDNYHADLAAVCRWLKPQLDGLDRVVSTVSFLNHPDMIVPVLVDLPPATWFAKPLDAHRTAEWQYFDSYGKFVFLYDPLRLDWVRRELAATGKPARVAFIFRPGETALGQPDFVATAPDGTPTLLVFIRDV